MFVIIKERRRSCKEKEWEKEGEKEEEWDGEEVLVETAYVQTVVKEFLMKEVFHVLR